MWHHCGFCFLASSQLLHYLPSHSKLRLVHTSVPIVQKYDGEITLRIIYCSRDRPIMQIPKSRVARPYSTLCTAKNQCQTDRVLVYSRFSDHTCRLSLVLVGRHLTVDPLCILRMGINGDSRFSQRRSRSLAFWDG
jgi:hypothetical protein